MRNPVGLLWLVAACGCAASMGGVPDWAKHVRPAGVEVAATTDQLSWQLVNELQHPRLIDGHLAAEQIALVGVREIAAGHPVDGALWLAIGSYRYHQETREAVVRGRAGFQDLPVNVRVRAYAELVNAEIDRYSSFGFDRELTALDARVYGRGEAEKALQEQLTALGKTTPIERESLRDALWELRPSTAVVEGSHYPQLVEEFHQRLLGDFRSDPRDEHPAIYLARTPIAALQADAVQATSSYFEPTVCASVAEAFPALRPAMMAALESPRPQTRANAAAVLGMAPSVETRSALEARLAVEPDLRAQLVMAFALVHHGATERLAALTQALQSCHGAECTLPVMLLQWLPLSSKGDLDQASLARILLGNQYEPHAHLFAAAALRDLGRREGARSRDDRGADRGRAPAQQLRRGVHGDPSVRCDRGGGGAVAGRGGRADQGERPFVADGAQGRAVSRPAGRAAGQGIDRRGPAAAGPGDGSRRRDEGARSRSGCRCGAARARSPRRRGSRQLVQSLRGAARAHRRRPAGSRQFSARAPGVDGRPRRTRVRASWSRRSSTRPTPAPC